MSEQFKIKNIEIQELTHTYVEKLTKIWTRIFDTNMCMENLNRLQEHAKIFYEELVAESLDKESYIQKEINELQEEAGMLRRLLKTEVQLPSIQCTGVPLLTQQMEIDESLTALREELRLRREQICELLLEQEELCEELGESPLPLLADPLPSNDELQEFRNHLEQLKQERLDRMGQLSNLRREIKGYLTILALQVNTETDNRLLNQRQMKLDKETFTALQRMQEFYGGQVREIQERIDVMRKQLETLWDRLNVSPNTRRKFNNYTDYSQSTYDVYASELQRCEALKAQNIERYVQQIRTEIEQWWDKTLKSEVQRNRFSNFKNHCYTDDLLVLHELELEDLKSYYERNQQIFELYAERRVLWERMTALEAKAREPGRYNNRGGQLLKEEKERKTIASKLPRIEKQIVELVHDYQAREHTPFLVYGVDILEAMDSEWEQKRAQKEQLSSARKQGQTPLTQSKLTRQPMSLRNNISVVGSMRKTPSTTNMSMKPMLSSQKRKLHPTEQHTPLAKRSLIHALNSPSVFQKPGALLSVHKRVKHKDNRSPTKTHVIATTLNRRRSKRYSNSSSSSTTTTASKKRRSLNRSKQSGSDALLPHIIVEECASDGYMDVEEHRQADDTYDSFQKCIEPTSRSSTLLATNTQVNRKHRQRIIRPKRHVVATGAAAVLNGTTLSESERLQRLPNPRLMRVPSKQNVRYISPTRVHSPGSASTSSSSRKLTTKNLPIII